MGRGAGFLCSKQRENQYQQKQTSHPGVSKVAGELISRTETTAAAFSLPREA
jgi:hypothetical protein